MIRQTGIQGGEMGQEVLVACLWGTGQQQQLLLLLDAQLDGDQMLVPGGPKAMLTQAGEGKYPQTARLQCLHAVAGGLTTELMMKIEKLISLPVELLDVFAAVIEGDSGSQQPLLDPR